MRQPCRQAASRGNSGVWHGEVPERRVAGRGLGPTRHQIGPAFPTALQGRFGARGPAVGRDPGAGPRCPGTSAAHRGPGAGPRCPGTSAAHRCPGRGPRRRRRARAVRLRRPHVRPPLQRHRPRPGRHRGQHRPQLPGHRHGVQERPGRNDDDRQQRLRHGLRRRRQRRFDVQLEPRDARAAVRVDRPLRRPLLGRRHLGRRRRLGRTARRCPLPRLPAVPDGDPLQHDQRERPGHRRDLVDPLPGLRRRHEPGRRSRQRRLHRRKRRDRHRHRPLRRLGASRRVPQRRGIRPASPRLRRAPRGAVRAAPDRRHLALRLRDAAVGHRRRAPRDPRLGRRPRHHRRCGDVRRPRALRHAQPGHERLQLDHLARRRRDDGAHAELRQPTRRRQGRVHDRRLPRQQRDDRDAPPRDRDRPLPARRDRARLRRGPAARDGRPDHLGHRARRPDAQRRPWRLAGIDADHLRLPVAPLRRGGRELHRCRGRQRGRPTRSGPPTPEPRCGSS